MSKGRGIFKFLLVWVCVGCAIVAVLNIPDRFTYEGLQTASAMVTAKTDLVESELGYLNIVSSCTDVYDPSVFQTFHLVPVEDIENADGSITKVENTYAILMADGNLGFPGTTTEMIVEPIQLDPKDVPKVESMLFFLSHSSSTKLNIGFAVNMISFYASAIFNIFFDSLPVIFSILRATLYLLGIG